MKEPVPLKNSGPIWLFMRDLLESSFFLTTLQLSGFSWKFLILEKYMDFFRFPRPDGELVSSSSSVEN